MLSPIENQGKSIDGDAMQPFVATGDNRRRDT
jgi:hypothetical protein